jgi:hypothetical protein
MIKEDELLELDYNFGLENIKGIENNFDIFLRENDLLYKEKIKFNVTYNIQYNYYKIKIFPAREGFDSQEYFGDNFAEGLGRIKLRSFKEKNNIGSFTY